jgi:hypothetical protein
MTPSPAAAELEQLRDRRRKLAAHRDRVQADVRTAAGDLVEAEQALATLEAKAAAGTVSAKERSEVERRLAEAQRRRAEPWEQREAGATAALRDADRALQVFADEHLDELIADAEQAVEPVVARLNSLALELAAAIVEAPRQQRDRADARARRHPAFAWSGRTDTDGGAQPRLEPLQPRRRAARGSPRPPLRPRARRTRCRGRRRARRCGVTDQTSSADQLGQLLDPVRASQLKRQQKAALARALAGPQPETIPDDVVDVLADKIADRLLAKLSERP